MAENTKKTTEQGKSENVSYYVHESEVARMERVNKRMFIVMIALIIALVGSWIGFFVYEAQFEDMVITQENEGGYNNYIGNDGDIFNGESEADNPEASTQDGR